MTEGWVNYAKKYVAKHEAAEPNRLPSLVKKRQRMGQAIDLKDFMSGLLDNEAGVRERALDGLTGVLQNLGDYTAERFTQLWEGLFLCFWNTDRPLTQLDVANRIAALVHRIPDADGNAHRLLWLRVFFDTLLSNWSKLDHHRLDKYYTLCRRVVCEAFRFLGAPSTSAEDRQHFYETLARTLRAPLLAIPMHLADTWVEEAIEAQLPPEVFTESLQLWLDALAVPGPLQRHILLRVFTQRLFESKAVPVDREKLQLRVEAMLDDSKGKRRLFPYYQILHGLGALPTLFEESLTKGAKPGKARRQRGKKKKQGEKRVEGEEVEEQGEPEEAGAARVKSVRKAPTKKPRAPRSKPQRPAKELKRRGKKPASGLHGSRLVKRSTTTVVRGTVADLL